MAKIDFVRSEYSGWVMDCMLEMLGADLGATNTAETPLREPP